MTEPMFPTPRGLLDAQNEKVNAEVARIGALIRDRMLAANPHAVIYLSDEKLQVEAHLQKSVIEEIGAQLKINGWSAKANLDEATDRVTFAIVKGK